MKYLIIISLLFLFACDKPQSINAHYELANDAIDSILKQNMQLQVIVSNARAGNDLNPYLKSVIDRYIFAMIYQMELNKIERGIQKNKLIRRYNKEIHADPYDFFPIGEMDSIKRSLFMGN
jgi:hypothetical protein